MSIKNALASVPVKDLVAASAWYERLIGRPADSRPMPEVVEWKFERGGWLQVYRLPQRAGGGSVTLAVDDLEAVVTRVQALGIDTTQRSSGAQVETLMISDPDGNHIAFARTIDGSMAR